MAVREDSRGTPPGTVANGKGFDSPADDKHSINLNT